MGHRGLAVGIAVAAIAALGFAPAAASAQTTEADRPAARTAWGDPDLQGIWNNATLTPFQRPEALGEQEFLTEPSRPGR